MAIPVWWSESGSGREFARAEVNARVFPRSANPGLQLRLRVNNGPTDWSLTYELSPEDTEASVELIMEWAAKNKIGQRRRS